MRIYSPSITGSTAISGALIVTQGITADLVGTASFATTASFALNAIPTNTGSLMVTGSVAGNVLTFTKGDASTFNLTVNTGSAGAAFPFTGSAQITGSLGVTGSVIIDSPNEPQLILTGSDNINVSLITDNSILVRSRFLPTISLTAQAVDIASIPEPALYLQYDIGAGAQQLFSILAETGSTGIVTTFNSGLGLGSIDIKTPTRITGSTQITGSLVITGSVRGRVSSLFIGSNTASMDLSTGNFFDLTIVSGSNTFINPTNITAGQTINLKVNQPNPGNGTVSFPSSVKQVSGSLYVPTTGAGATDIVTFISFDSTSLFLSNVKNLV